jgi:hypothetical protein
MRLTFWTLRDAVTAEKERKAPLATGYAWDPIESKYVTESHPDFSGGLRVRSHHKHCYGLFKMAALHDDSFWAVESK